jgi:hypothetical protein
MKPLTRYPVTRLQSVRSVSTSKCLELQPQEVSALLLPDNDDTIPDEDMELHLLREQELRARMDLQELFAEGQLGCT